MATELGIKACLLSNEILPDNGRASDIDSGDHAKLMVLGEGVAADADSGEAESMALLLRLALYSAYYLGMKRAAANTAVKN